MKDSEYWHEGNSLALEQQPDGSWKPATPEKYRPAIVERFLCFIGYHSWSWRAPTREINGVRTLIIDETIPPYAKCVRCDKRYR